MRLIMVSAALVALSACAPAIPESGPQTGTGVGFGDYDDYEARREAELTGTGAGQTFAPPSAVTSQPLSATGEQSESAAVAAAARAALGDDSAERAANSGEPVLHASPQNPAPAVVNSVGISNENDFEAVGNQRSIENDAERIARNRAQYQVASVEALPSRAGGEGPNIVAYALQTKHPAGTQVYRRVGVNRDARFQRNCAKYTSPDKAQIDFLEKGGPERDRLGIDPDGDGFACGWDPAPFRKAVSG